jgi:hypothetical protein
MVFSSVRSDANKPPFETGTSSDVTVPDYLEPILAWRIWVPSPRVYDLGRAARLEPRILSFNGTIWEPYQALEAQHVTGLPCVAGRPCRCGIYAVKDPEQLRPAISWGPMGIAGSTAAIIGQVWLWGRFTEHAYGWRAQFAYPAKFVFASGCDGRRLAATYGVQLEEDESWILAKRFERESRSHFAFQFQRTQIISSRITRASLPPPPSRSSLLKFPPNSALTPSTQSRNVFQAFVRVCRPIGWVWNVMWLPWRAARPILKKLHDNSANRRWRNPGLLNIWS